LTSVISTVMTDIQCSAHATEHNFVDMWFYPVKNSRRQGVLLAPGLAASASNAGQPLVSPDQRPLSGAHRGFSGWAFRFRQDRV